MTFVCYLIVCVTLLYSFDQTESSTPIPRYTVKQDNEELFEKLENVELQYEYLANIISPYWNLTYDKELDQKQSSCSAMVHKIVKRYDGLKNPCKLIQIVPSPVTRAYRNIDLFFVGLGVDGNPKTVGMKVGKIVSGKVFCIHPTKVSTVKESHKRVVQVFEDFVRLSPLRASIKLSDGGHWRSLLVRSNEVGNLMACVTVHPVGYTVETILEQQEALKDYFFERLPNITLFHQQCKSVRCSRHEAPFILLYGKSYFLETLHGYKFIISPDTLFPVNKMGAEVLYDTIMRTAKLKPNTTLLDVWSGTGTTSIVASKLVREAIGFDYMTQSVIDAKRSAEINHINNIKFKLGVVDKDIQSELKRLNGSSDIVTIVNYGDIRLGVDVMRVIRKSPEISRVVYISSRPESVSAIKNFQSLCAFKTSKFPSFRLTKAIPVDINPQTPNVAVILIFQRFPH